MLVHYHRLVVSVYTRLVETTIDKCVNWGTSMHVQTYLDFSLREASCGLLVFPWLVQLGAWPGGSWLPWRAAPWSLLFGVCFSVIKRLLLNGPNCLFHLLTCTMGFAPIKRTCAA